MINELDIKNISEKDFDLCQKISILNNKINKGNLEYAFSDMVNLLNKKFLSPFLITLVKDNITIGYCIFYFLDDNVIHISQICLHPKYHNNSLAKEIIDYLKNKNIKKINADILTENIQSKTFFEKNGFNILKRNNNRHCQAIWRKNKI